MGRVGLAGGVAFRQRSRKTAEKPTNLLNAVDQFADVRLLKVNESGRNQDLGLQLLKRSSGDCDEMQKVTSRPSCLSFRDVRGNRNRRSSNLGCQTEELFRRKPVSDLVDPMHEIHGLLPDDKLLVQTNRQRTDLLSFFTLSSHSPLATRHSPLATRHSPLATRHSPLATRHSPLATRHSPLATRHSPLATRHSPLKVPSYAATAGTTTILSRSSMMSSAWTFSAWPSKLRIRRCRSAACAVARRSSRATW
jgi:hypothetical protein